jgi:hypothetical protein
VNKEFKNFIIQTLRKASYRHKPRAEAQRASKCGVSTFQCACCGTWVYTGKKTLEKANIAVSEGVNLIAGKIKIDHIDPVVGVEGFDGTNWTLYITKMFCPVEDFQIVCTECHSIKSKEETRLRALYKRLKKAGDCTKKVEEEFRIFIDSYRRNV